MRDRPQTRPMDLPDAVADLAEHQSGVVTRQQLIAGGVTAAAVRWALGRSWRMLLPGVVLLAPGLPTDQQRLVAAQLFAGPDAWLGGETGAAVHGIPGCALAPPVCVLVPPHRTSRSVSWVRVSRTYLLDERIVTRGPLRLSCVARAVVDAAADHADTRQSRTIIIQAVQERAVRLDDAVHWMEARRTTGRPRLRRALAEAAIGAWSVPEADLLRLMAGSSVLPPAWANPTLHDADGSRLTTPDAWFDDVGLAVMVHSRQFHAGVLEWDATVNQDEDLRAARVEVLGVTPGAIAAEPRQVLARVESAYQRALAWPRPRQVIASPRDPLSAPWQPNAAKGESGSQRLS